MSTLIADVNVEWDLAYTAMQIAQCAAHRAALSHDTRRNPPEWQAAEAVFAIGLYGFTIAKEQAASAARWGAASQISTYPPHITTGAT